MHRAFSPFMYFVLIVMLSSCGSRDSVYQQQNPLLEPDTPELIDNPKHSDSPPIIESPIADEEPSTERDLGSGADKEPLGDGNTKERDLGKGADAEPKPSGP